jgi:glycosyltransferase involved in cell wall biosynthesis
MLKVSFLIPAYNAQDTLPILVHKLLKQAGDIYPLELVISEDDGFSYRTILPEDKRIVYAVKGLKSRPGPARTRALEAATGSHISVLDADDDVSDDYLMKIYTTLKTYNVFAIQTVYKKDGLVIRSFDEKMLTVDNFINFYGSIHTIAPRHWTTKYVNITAQDVLATLNVIVRNNGLVPVIDAQYILNIHDGSYCSLNISIFNNTYQQGINESVKIAKELKNEKLAPLIKRMYQARLDMGILFDKEVKNHEYTNYHQYILNVLKNNN